MKLKTLNIITLALSSSLFIASCSTSKTVAFRDDVYQGNAKAVERPYVSPDYYYSEEPSLDEIPYDDEQVDAYYDDEQFNDGGYYSDEITDSEYANRFNRFYYPTAGTSYYDRYYGYGMFNYYDWYMDPFMSPSFYFGYNPLYMSGLYWNLGFYDPFFYPSRFGFYGSYGFGYNPFYYSRYDRFGYGGFGGYGYGYGYPYLTHNYGYYGPARDMSVRSSSRDMMNIRSSRSTPRVSDVVIERGANGRISTRVANSARGLQSGSRNAETRGTTRERIAPSSRVNSQDRGTNTRVGTTRGTTTRGTTINRGGTQVRPGQTGQTQRTGTISRGTQRPTRNEAVRPSSNRGSTVRPTRPTTTRPTTTRPSNVRPSGSSTRQPAVSRPQSQPERNTTPTSVSPTRSNPVGSGSSGSSRTTSGSSTRTSSRGGN